MTDLKSLTVQELCAAPHRSGFEDDTVIEARFSKIGPTCDHTYIVRYMNEHGTQIGVVYVTDLPDGLSADLAR